MDVGPSLVADGEAPELSELGRGALDDPPVLAQTLAALDAATGDAVLDATAGEIGQIGTAPRAPIDQLLEPIPRVGALALENRRINRLVDRLAASRRTCSVV